MRVEILGGPFDGQCYMVDGMKTTVLVAVPKNLRADEEGEPLEPFDRYELPVRKGKAYWNERVKV